LYQLPHALEYFKNNTVDFIQARETQLKFLQNLEQKVQQQSNN